MNMSLVDLMLLRLLIKRLSMKSFPSRDLCMNESVMSTDIMRGNAYVWLDHQGDQKRALALFAMQMINFHSRSI